MFWGQYVKNGNWIQEFTCQASISGTSVTRPADNQGGNNLASNANGMWNGNEVKIFRVDGYR